MAKEVCINEWNREWFQEMAEVIDIHKPVHVYRNLHKHCWSVRQDGKVKVHTSYICLQDVNFVVQPAGREKVLREQRKNVHAYVKGYLISASTCNRLEDQLNLSGTQDAITYNPYKHPYFTCGDAQVVHAQLVDMDADAEHDKMYGYGIKTKELV